MTDSREQEARHVILVDCPCCDQPTSLADGAAELRCDACSVIVPLAADAPQAPATDAALLAAA